MLKIFFLPFQFQSDRDLAANSKIWESHEQGSKLLFKRQQAEKRNVENRLLLYFSPRTRLGQTWHTREGFEDQTVLHLPLINTLKSIVFLKETNNTITYNQTWFTYPTERK